MRISTPSGRDLRDRPREDQLIFPWNSRGSGLRGLLYISSDPVTTYPRGKAAPTSASTPETRICWDAARSSRSCIRKASNWSPHNASAPTRSWTVRPRRNWPCSVRPRPMPCWRTPATSRRATIPRRPRPSGSRFRPSGPRRAFPGVSRRFRWRRTNPREVDPGFVIVEPDEVKTKAQSSTGRQEVWTYTAVVLVAGWRSAFAEATAEGLWFQVSALLLELGVLSGERPLLVLGDGAAWIRLWFEGLGVSPKAMIVCWWHRRKRCYEQMSAAGGPKERRRGLEKELLGQLWEGKVDAAVELLQGTLEWVRNPKAVADLSAYLKKRRASLPDYQQRQRAGLWIASTRVEKFNDWAASGRCKHQGMSWTPRGVLALAAMEAARRNGELDRWRQDRALPERGLPEPMRKVA